MKNLLIVFAFIFMTSCSSIAVSLTPQDVKQAVVEAAAIATLAEKDPPVDENLTEYLRLNAELWRSLADFYGLLNGDK